MRLLTLVMMVALLTTLVGVEAHGRAEQIEQYEVIMYEGIPPESLPKKERKKLPPEKSLLIAPVDAEGKFQASLNGAMFEGRLKSVKGGQVEIEIKQSQLNSTSGFPINAIVKLDQALSPAGYGISSILFSYYFRVRSKGSDRQECP